MKVIIIAAVAQNGAIGKDNNLIWKLPNDMKFFKETTKSHIVITGRKNYESIPEKFRPLSNRINIVVSRDTNYKADGAIVVSSISEALCNANYQNDFSNKVFIIGGGEMYKQTINEADEMYITHIKNSFEADVFFPEINDNNWNKKVIQHQNIDEKHQYEFDIVKYTRK